MNRTHQRKDALILIGYQNDYFEQNGILHSVIEVDAHKVLSHTIKLLEKSANRFDLILSTPILFSENYSELKEPVGILEIIKKVGAFKCGTEGAKTIIEFDRFKDKIIELPGKKGLNAFSNTDLELMLSSSGITDVTLCGVVASICIDSTGRRAHELGYKVHIIPECVGARSALEHQFYSENIFPLYADVLPITSFMKGAA